MSQGDTPDAVATVGVLLIDDRGWILLQLRDGHGTYPYHWATVGGAVEAGETLMVAIRREAYEETGYRLSGPLGCGGSATLVLPDGQVRHATLFFARYDGLQPIRCLEGLEITFVDPSTLDTLQVYPGQKALILEALHRYREAAQDAPVHIEDYDPRWPSLFETERSLLNKVLGKWIAGPIEHVGSTAVPRLRAKPVIDIMVAVRNLEDSRPAIDVLKKLSYVYYPHRADVMHWFCKPSPGFRTHHLHLVPFASTLWTERLTFRDYLRNHPETAAEYVALKERLAGKHRFARDAYTEAKSPFIHHVLAIARSS